MNIESCTINFGDFEKWIEERGIPLGEGDTVADAAERMRRDYYTKGCWSIDDHIKVFGDPCRSVTIPTAGDNPFA